jgi:uncharacterized protein YaaQ
MKMIIAIVQDEDASRLMESLMGESFRVTKLASTGGFLHGGNTTLLSGVADEQVDKCLEVIKTVCGTRTRMIPSATSGMDLSYPIEVTVGGAMVFTMDVAQTVKF